ncbi:hypothetical protein BaRGS_00018753 [Batillaria attramentaria]|uniref:Chitin-binding type-2 domain-containing protein n=1 Tax=Batillaria attramentaria TaxID=370345 RepID=A0ABD0KT26_9CAEN
MLSVVSLSALLVCAAIPLTVICVETATERCQNDAKFAYNFDDCKKFYQCVHKKPVMLSCPARLVFSLRDERCVYKSDITDGCSTAPPPEGFSTMAVSTEAAVTEDGSAAVTTEAFSSPPATDQDSETTTMADAFSSPSPTAESLQASVNARCAAGASRFQNPFLCNRYFDCNAADAMGNPFLMEHEQECPYPLLYNTFTKTCQEPEMVDCAGRIEPKNPCDYSVNMCAGPHCRPCESRFASCENMTDGLHPWPMPDIRGESMVHYVECRSERNLGQGVCFPMNGTLYVFSRTLRQCVPYDQVIFEQCSSTLQRLPHNADCHRYYDCGGYEYMRGDAPIDSSQFLATCPYPMLFNVPSRRCQNFQTILCIGRFEAKTPCDYKDTPCDDPEHASCEGLSDGKNVFRTREGGPHYVICQRERTVEKRQCEVDEETGMYKIFSPVSHSCVSLSNVIPQN